MRRKYYGSAAHFILGDRCRFHLATEIGRYLISTVGEYHSKDGLGPLEIGAGRLFETFVFVIDPVGERCKCGCGLPSPTDFYEVDSDGYNTARAATEGHEAMCVKYEALAVEE